MSTPPTPTVGKTRKARTGQAWQEFNSLPPTPPPEMPVQSVNRSIANPPVVSPPVVESPVAKPPLVSPPVGGPPAPANSRVLVILILAAGVAAGAAAGLFAFYPGSKFRGSAHTSSTATPTAAAPAKLEEAARPKPVLVPIPPADDPPPAKRHIEITVQPAEASLFLDDRVVESHRIKLDVQKARTSHVVLATAPGHIPYRKTISYADDVYLDIKLKKAEVPSPHAGAKVRAPQVAVYPPSNDTVDGKKSDSKAAPAATQAEDFGMSLQRPTARRPSKKIDESDPYGP